MITFHEESNNSGDMSNRDFLKAEADEKWPGNTPVTNSTTSDGFVDNNPVGILNYFIKDEEGKIQLVFCKDN
jgi:hypothetical protein